MPHKYNFKITQFAESDLSEIADYIFTSSPQNSRAVKAELAAAIESLTMFPGRFKVHENNRDPSKVVRSMTVQSFTIFYRIIEPASLVEILTIRRGTRDRPPRFFRS